MVLVLGYILFTKCVVFFFRENGAPPSKQFIAQVFDSVTFAFSFLVLMGFIEPAVLVLIGGTKPFLLAGGIAGTGYALGQIGK